MSVTERAEIEAGLTGMSSVIGGFQDLKKNIEAVASGINRGLGGAPLKVAQGLKSIAAEGLRAAGVFQTISLAGAVEEAKHFDQATARLGQSSGISVANLQSHFKGLEAQILTSAPAMADFSQSLGRATYDSQSAAEAVAGLGMEAVATGRSLQDELQLGETLRSGLGVVGDVTAELDRMRAIAEQVGTVGGHLAFKDSLTALRPQLEGVALNSDEARAKIEALVAVLGKGLKPGAQTAVAGAAFSTLKSMALDIERATGKQVVNDNGELIDPTETLKGLRRRSDKIHGGNRAEQRRALISTYGMDLGLAIYRTDLNDVNKVAGLKGTGKTESIANSYLESAPGQREQVRLAKDSAMRGIGEGMLGAQDMLVKELGANTTALLELGAGLKGLGGFFGSSGGSAVAAGGAAATGAAAAGKLGAVATEAGAVAESLEVVGAALAGGAGFIAAVGGAALALAAFQVKALSDIGGDRDEMGRKWREEHGVDEHGRPLAKPTEESRAPADDPEWQQRMAEADAVLGPKDGRSGAPSGKAQERRSIPSASVLEPNDVEITVTVKPNPNQTKGN